MSSLLFCTGIVGLWIVIIILKIVMPLSHATDTIMMRGIVTIGVVLGVISSSYHQEAPPNGWSMGSVVSLML